MAHEIGHTLGMNHDFNGQQGNPRKDSSGKTCTKIGGVMDYDGKVRLFKKKYLVVSERVWMQFEAHMNDLSNN